MKRTMKSKETRMPAATAPSEYLKRPYGRVVVPEPDGTFRAEIMEFPGCLATGNTAAEALTSLEAVATSWLEATVARGLQVPEPIGAESSHSGKLVTRLGRDLHRRAAHFAAAQGISLNQFIVSSVAERVGMLARPATPRVSSIALRAVVNVQAEYMVQDGSRNLSADSSTHRAQIPGYFQRGTSDA